MIYRFFNKAVHLKLNILMQKYNKARIKLNYMLLKYILNATHRSI